MISISGGLIVTRASSDARLGADFEQADLRQVAAAAAGRAACCSRWLSFPGLPKLPFLLLGGGVGDRRLENAPKRRTLPRTAAPAGAPAPPAQGESRSADAGRAAGRRSRAGPGAAGGRRREFAAAAAHRRRSAGSSPPTSAIMLPPVRVTDNLSLRAREYVISLKGVEIARYEMPQGCELAIPTGAASRRQPRGHATREPAFGIARPVDSDRAAPSTRATPATRWSTPSACWARICPS